MRTSGLTRDARTAAGFAVWAADAFLPVFLCLDDITDGRADDQSDHNNQNDINGSHADAPFPLCLCFQGVFCLDLLIFTDDHGGEDGGNGKDDRPTEDRHPGSAEASAGDQRTEEEYQEADGVTN